MNTKVIITAEDQTAAGIASVKSSMSGLGATFGVFAAGAAVAAGAIAELAKQSVGLWKDQVNFADSMGEMSVRMGMSIKDINAWKAAADMSGSSLEAMSAGTRMLAKHMVDHGAAFREAGIDTKDANKAFEQLSDLFNGMSDPVARLDLVTRIFGRSLGQQLLPVLVAGSEAMKEIRKATDPYGEALARLSPEAQKFNDQMYLLGVNVKTLAAESVHPLVQRLNEAAESFKKAQAAGLSFFQSITGFGVRGLTESVDDAKRNAPRHIAELLDQRKALENRTPRPELNLGTNTLAAGIAEIDKKIAYFRAIQGIKAGVDGEVLPPGISDTEAVARALKAGLGSDKNSKGNAAAKTPLEKMLELGQKRIAALNGTGYDEQMVSVDSVAWQYAAKEDADLEKRRLALEQMAETRMENTRIATEGEEAIREAMEKTGAAIKDTDNFARDMGLTMASAFEDAAINGKKFGEVLQGLGKDIARMFLRKTVTEPMGGALTDMFKGFKIGDLFKNAAGGVYSSPDLHSYANTIVSSPTLFKFARGGAFGLMGEAGAEAIMPLKRGADGKLGVAGGGSNVVVNVIESPGKGGQQERRNEGGVQIIDVFVERIKSAIAADIAHGRGSVPAVLESSYGLNRAAGAF